MSVSYAYLEDRFPTEVGSSRDKLQNAFRQLLVDNLIMDAFFVLSSFVTTGFLQGLKMRVIGNELRQHFASSWLACMSTNAGLAPVEFTLFRFVPLKWRTLGMNLTDVIWTAVLSLSASRLRA